MDEEQLELPTRKRRNGINFGEIVIEETSNGYLFHSGDGNVKYRSNDQHEQHIESLAWQEPRPAPQKVNY